MTTLRVAFFFAVLAGVDALAWVDAGPIKPISPMSLDELGVRREDHELANTWLSLDHGTYQNEIDLEQWIRDKTLSRQILQMGSQRWARAVLSTGMIQSSPSLGIFASHLNNDPETSPIVLEFCRKLAHHYLKWIPTAPWNHPNTNAFVEIACLANWGTDQDIKLLEQIEEALRKRRNDFDPGSNDIEKQRWIRSFDKTLAIFPRVRSHLEGQSNGLHHWDERDRGRIMEHFQLYADSHWIYGHGIAKGLEDAEARRLEADGKLYKPATAATMKSTSGSTNGSPSLAVVIWIGLGGTIVFFGLAFSVLRRSRRRADQTQSE